MAVDRLLDPRTLEYNFERPLLLEKQGNFFVVNRSVALRYCLDGGAVLEVTAGHDKRILDKKRLLAGEEAIKEFLSKPGNPSMIGSAPCLFDRDAEDPTAYVGSYRLRLIGERAGFQMGLWVAAQVPVEFMPFSRALSPKTVVRRLLEADRAK